MIVRITEVYNDYSIQLLFQDNSEESQERLKKGTWSYGGIKYHDNIWSYMSLSLWSYELSSELSSKSEGINSSELPQNIKHDSIKALFTQSGIKGLINYYFEQEAKNR